MKRHRRRRKAPAPAGQHKASPRPRSAPARELADRRYRPRVVKRATAYRRRPKHAHRDGAGEE